MIQQAADAREDIDLDDAALGVAVEGQPEAPVNAQANAQENAGSTAAVADWWCSDGHGDISGH